METQEILALKKLGLIVVHIFVEWTCGDASLKRDALKWAFVGR